MQSRGDKSFHGRVSAGGAAVALGVRVVACQKSKKLNQLYGA